MSDSDSKTSRLTTTVQTLREAFLAPQRFATDRYLLFGMTFVVAICCIVYELIYAEILTVIFGGTVLRYSLTIGLFLFSFGIGSFLFNYIDTIRDGFFRVEAGLAIGGPAGLLFILLLNSFPEAPLIGGTVGLALSHVPIIFVGVLSGLEIPLLTAFVNSSAVDDESETRNTAADSREDEGSTDITDDNSGISDFSVILSMDYFGSLVGTVVYALVLYPRLGLISSVFILGLLNGIVAIAFALYFGDGITPSITPDSATTRAVFGICLLVSGLYVGAVAFDEGVEETISEFYLSQQIEAEWPAGNVEINIIKQFTTPYQKAIIYERQWVGLPDARRWMPKSERCLRLDMAVQLCESWVQAYHRGLVDVPAALFWNGHVAEGKSGAAMTGTTGANRVGMAGNASVSTERDGADVLLIGGGDWIAASHLLRYNVSIDHVDIDRQFMQYAAHHRFFQQYHEGAAFSPQVNTTVADGYTYLRRSDEQYDTILIDLPGIRDDDLLKLYSKQFYGLLASHLEQDGVVVTWAYSRYAFPEHHKVYMNTIRAAGFDSYLPYYAYNDLDNDGDAERVERFYVLALNERDGRVTLDTDTKYLRRYGGHDRNRDTIYRWRTIPYYDSVEVNSIFDPNYDIIVEYEKDQ